jgi:protein gp37
MSTQTSIEWTEQTWNPTTGCTKVSPGCQHCYAGTMAHRLRAMGVKGYEKGFKLTIQPHRLYEPLQRRKPTIYFVNSMSDLFHEKIQDAYIRQVFDVMKNAPFHTFQVLTKRAERMMEFFKSYEVSQNVWLGVTVENKTCKYRIDYLRKTPANIKFLSLEPLLGSLGKLNLSGIDWVIVGGESGPKARSIEADWVREVRDQCIEQSVAFFFKQWGGVQKKKNGRILDGVTWDEMPTHELTSV